MANPNAKNPPVVFTILPNELFDFICLFKIDLIATFFVCPLPIKFSNSLYFWVDLNSSVGDANFLYKSIKSIIVSFA